MAYESLYWIPMHAYFFLKVGRKKEELYSENKDTNLPFSTHGVNLRLRLCSRYIGERIGWLIKSVSSRFASSHYWQWRQSEMGLVQSMWSAALGYFNYFNHCSLDKYDRTLNPLLIQKKMALHYLWFTFP